MSTLIIDSIDIKEGLFKKRYDFSEGFNIISSKGKNSVGKTTLLRLLIYALGEEVSMTQGFDPKGLTTLLAIRTESNKRLKVLRNDATLTISGEIEETRFVLPYELSSAKELIYGVKSKELAANILGAFFIDQDKGWTLLNRGKVTGGVRFSVESFMRGLAGKDYERQLARIKELDLEIEKYKFIIEAAGYKNRLVERPGANELSPDKSRDSERLIQLRIESASLRKQIAAIRRAQNSNDRFIRYLTDMGLQVKTESGNIVRVTADNLLYYPDNEKYMNGEVVALRAELEGIERRISEIENKLDVENKLFTVERVDTKEFDRQIAEMKLDLPSYERVLGSLRREKSSLEREIRKGISRGNRIFDLLTTTVDQFCQQLGIEDYFRKDAQGILTKTLKRKSGTKYHQLVFAYRLAYAFAVNEVCQIKLPLVIDSIRGQEMSQENFEKCIMLLKDQFTDHQIIVASISSNGIEADKIIEINGAVMENAESCESLGLVD